MHTHDGSDPAPPFEPTLELHFDRGTILCRRWPKGLEPGDLGLELDPRVGAWRGPGFHYDGLCRELERRGLSPPPLSGRAPERPEGRFARPALRVHQQAALSTWLACGRRGVVVLPTGAGKTHVALAAMAELGCATLCLAPTRALVEQWCREIAACYDGRVGRYGDGRRELAPVTVATFASANLHLPAIGDRFELCVVDEAHHLGGALREETLWMCTARARLGLTATPRRGAGPIGAAGPGGPLRESVLGGIVFEASFGALSGFRLAQLERVELGLELTEGERREYDAALDRFLGAFDRFRAGAPAGAGWTEFARAAGRTADGRAALRAWHAACRTAAFTEAKRRVLGELLDRHHGAPTLVFTADKATAYAIAAEHLVMPITSDIGRRERERALGAFRRGEIRVLVSPRVLNEGIDLPDTEVGIVVGGSQGRREYVQRVGRLLRPAADKRARLYELWSRGTFEQGQARRRREALAGEWPGASLPTGAGGPRC